MMLHCDNDLCIYERQGRCILDGISVNQLGMCAECILISIYEAEKESRKQSLLAFYLAKQPTDGPST